MCTQLKALETDRFYGCMKNRRQIGSYAARSVSEQRQKDGCQARKMELFSKPLIIP